MMLAALTSLALAVASDGSQDCPMHAQHEAGSAPMAATAATRSPYSGEEDRAIKALSDADVKAYLEGAGMGLAKAAELNRYPGPRHVLDNVAALELSDAQRTAIEASFQRMKAEAVTLGRGIVAAEQRLDALFAERRASPATVSDLTREVAELQGQLRAVHLRAHVEVRALLTPEQIARYTTLRGYGSGGVQ